jgi:hypothetical protein
MTFHHSSEIEEASSIQLEKQYSARELIGKLRAKTFSGYPGCTFVDKDCMYEVTIKIVKSKIYKGIS